MSGPTITHDVTLLRLKTNPVANDADWRATNDVTNFKADANPFQVVPHAQHSLGFLDLMIEFVDASGNPVNVANNTTVDIEILQLITPRLTDGRSSPPWLLALESFTLRGETQVGTTRPVKAPMILGIRIVSTANLPGGYNEMFVLGRYY